MDEKQPTGSPVDLRGVGAKSRKWKDRVAKTREAAEAAAKAPIDPEAAAPPPPPPKADDLTDRIMGIPVKYRNPDTGITLSAEIISYVPDEKAMDLIHFEVRRRIGNTPWLHLPDWMQFRHLAIANAMFQIKEAPDWVMERLGEDADFLIEVNRGLSEHANKYFRGNPRPGASGTVKPRLEVGPLTSLSAPLRDRYS